MAVRQLAGVTGAVVESSPEFIQAESSWAVELRLSCSHPSEFVPEETRWVALLHASYPAGSIRLYPAHRGGIVHTFPHQDRNVPSPAGHAEWRLGKPCLDSSSQRLGRIAGGPEPLGDREGRLRWHVERCLAWLRLAGEVQLMEEGQPFEVPQCPNELLNTELTVVHDEGEDTWPAWDGSIGLYGEVHWRWLTGFEKTVVAERFFRVDGAELRVCRRAGAPEDEPWIGYWWLWPAPIVLPPWHMPGSWAELRRIGDQLDVDVDEFFHWMADRSKGERNVVILLGHPIPRRWRGTPIEVHWQAVSRPSVPATIKPMDGFRANARGRRDRLRRDIFAGSKNLRYLKTSNWHPSRLQARGRLEAALRTQAVALIGAGALGSSVGELLARGGVTEILVIDHDHLEPGNLARHTLTGADIGKNKARATATRLRQAAPMSRISAQATSLPSKEALQSLLEPFDIVLDCTGDDFALKLLGEAWWSIPRCFVSASLGFAARRLFLYSAHGCTFPFEDFQASVDPWLTAERREWSADGETLEGAGCWSPLFPARSDDVWLAAATVTKYLERLADGNQAAGLQTFERTTGDQVIGYRAADIDSRKSR